LVDALLALPASVTPGAGVLPEQASGPLMVFPDTSVSNAPSWGGVVPELFVTETGPLMVLVATSTPAVFPDRVTGPEMVDLVHPVPEPPPIRTKPVLLETDTAPDIVAPHRVKPTAPVAVMLPDTVPFSTSRAPPLLTVMLPETDPVIRTDCPEVTVREPLELPLIVLVNVTLSVTGWDVLLAAKLPSPL